jgi:hypothetical protein
MFCRCVVQLGVLGYVILVPIFTTPYWFVVVSYAVVMCLVGAAEASSRPAYSFKVWHCVIWNPFETTCSCLTRCIKVKPWFIFPFRDCCWQKPQKPSSPLVDPEASSCNLHSNYHWHLKVLTNCQCCTACSGCSFRYWRAQLFRQ